MSKGGFEPPIAFERLEAMIAALHGGDDLDAAMRREILDALDWMYVFFAIQPTGRGRKHSALTHFRAYRVHVLVEQHGAYVRNAVDAVLGDAVTFLRRQALTKAYHSLKASTGFRQVRSISADVLASDAARLPLTRRKRP